MLSGGRLCARRYESIRNNPPNPFEPSSRRSIRALDVSRFVDILDPWQLLSLPTPPVRSPIRLAAVSRPLGRFALEIVGMLLDGERCVCELMSALDAAQSRLSFHLKALKDAGIVTDRRRVAGSTTRSTTKLSTKRGVHQVPQRPPQAGG